MLYPWLMSKHPLYSAKSNMGLIQLSFNGNGPAALIYQLQLKSLVSLISHLLGYTPIEIICCTDITFVGLRTVASVKQILVNQGPVSILYICTRLQSILFYLLVNSILKIIVHLLVKLLAYLRKLTYIALGLI